MSRLHATGFAVLVLAALAYVVSQTRRDASAQATTQTQAADMASSGGQTASPGQSAEADVKPSAANELLAPAVTQELPPGVSALPTEAPKSVTFGVILIAYQGAQAAPDTAPSKAAALERARSLLAQARQDFDGAVSKGDPGSVADAGRVPRGVLEPEVEYALFTLQPGNVHPEPLDTPRGYWIVKRMR